MLVTTGILQLGKQRLKDMKQTSSSYIVSEAGSLWCQSLACNHHTKEGQTAILLGGICVKEIGLHAAIEGKQVGMGLESRYVYLSSNKQVLYIAARSLTWSDDYLPFQKKSASAHTHHTESMNNAGRDMKKALGALKIPVWIVEKLGFLTCIPNEKQPYLFLVNRWDHLCSEITGLFILGSLISCPLDASRVYLTLSRQAFLQKDRFWTICPMTYRAQWFFPVWDWKIRSYLHKCLGPNDCVN